METENRFSGATRRSVGDWQSGQTTAEDKVSMGKLLLIDKGCDHHILPVFPFFLKNPTQSSRYHHSRSQKPVGTSLRILFLVKESPPTKTHPAY